MQPFDPSAGSYDRDFTNSRIGRLLRAQVWNYLNSILAGPVRRNILELNCGTGEDAIFFGKLGHHVLATDASEEMIRVAAAKRKKAGMENRVELRQMDIRETGENFKGVQFDLVFSNFGGLNCIDAADLHVLSGNLADCLKPGGRFVAVVMGKVCLWESVYFLSKFKFDTIFRRNTNDCLPVLVNGEIINTWYYSPPQFSRLFENKFHKTRVKPLGIFLPPSYMEKRFVGNEGLLRLLGRMETSVSKVSLLARFADHFIIDLKKT